MSKRIEYLTGTVSQVVTMGEGGYITIDVEKSMGKPLNHAPSHFSSFRLDLVEGVKQGDRIKMVIEVVE